MNLDQGWEYRWGDSPFEAGIPQWIKGKNPEQWKSIGFPSNPPDRNGQNNVWYRVMLPDQPDLGSSLYIFSIDLIAEAYLEGEMIYNYGHFEADGTGKFEGWPWHIVTLPRNYPGKHLYFRVYSDYPDIGLWGKVILGNEGHHLQKIIQEDLPRMTVGVFFVFFGILLMALSLYRLSSRVFLMGLFMINLGLMSIATVQFKQLILFAPLSWQYLGAGNYFLFPATMAALVHALYGKGPWQIYRWIWQIHLLFFTYAMIFPLAGMINLSSTYIHFDFLALVTMLVLSVSLNLQARKGTTNQKLLSFGFWVMYLILVYDGLVAHDFLPFASSSEFLGPMVLAFCFGIIIVREYNELKQRLRMRTKELEELNIHLEKRIDERTKELQLSNETKNKFFSIIAHDLRSPIGSLNVIFNQITQKPSDIDEELYKAIRSATTQTDRLLDNLLKWASIQRDKVDVKPKNCQLHIIIDSTLGLLAETARLKEIEITQDCSLEIYVWADPSMLATVSRNLVSNAIKYTKQGGRIQIIAHSQDNEVRVEIRDTGVGVQPEILKNMFQVGKIVSSPGTNHEPGTGLGLALCKEFVESNSGKIGVESELGKGSCFWFTLPKGLITEPAREDWVDRLKSLDVLVVEDNPLHIHTTYKALEGCNLTLATDGPQAVAKALKSKAALIFMDIKLPGFNGIEAARQIWEKANVRPWIIALTSLSKKEIEAWDSGLQFDGYLNKPLDKDELMLVLNPLLTKS